MTLPAPTLKDNITCLFMCISIFSAIFGVVSLVSAEFFVEIVGVNYAFGMPFMFAVVAAAAHLITLKLEE